MEANWSLTCRIFFNSLHAKFISRIINMYWQFLSFLYPDMTQVVEFFPHVRQEPTYFTYSVSWLLMTWWWKEPGHQQPWYWPSWNEVTRSLHVKGHDINFAFWCIEAWINMADISVRTFLDCLNLLDVGLSMVYETWHLLTSPFCDWLI